jgi:hypothetical protein
VSGTTTVLLAVGTLTWAKPDDGHVVVLAGGLVAILSSLELEAGSDHAAAGRRGASPKIFGKGDQRPDGKATDQEGRKKWWQNPHRKSQSI